MISVRVAAMGMCAGLLAGCASWSDPVTFYQTARKDYVKYEHQEFITFSDEGRTGYADTKIDDLTYKVSARGTRVSSLEQTANVALLRAARLGRELGHTAFVVAESEAYYTCWAASRLAPALSATPTVNLTVRYGDKGTVVGVGEVLLVDEAEATAVQAVSNVPTGDNAMQQQFIQNWYNCN